MKQYIDTKESFGPDCLRDRTEAACSLNRNNFTYYELIGFLNSASTDLRYFALLNIDGIQDLESANIILSCLKDNDSRIRELSSAIITTHLKKSEYNHYFNNEKSVNLLTECVKDLNPKVCRNITCALQHVNDQLTCLEKLVTILETDNIFTIYWSLYALENIINSTNEALSPVIDEIVKILSKTSLSKEYQIREKSASVIRELNHKEYNTEILDELRKALLNDENFYVRNAISP